MSISLNDEFLGFEAYLIPTKEDVSNEAKAKARNLINKISQEKIQEVAVNLAEEAFNKFQRKLKAQFPTEPNSQFAQMTINRLKLTYFYNNRYLLGDLKKNLHGNESIEL